MSPDFVNKPAHYNQGKIEVIEFIEDQRLNFNKGNACKYLSRAGKKDPLKEIEDLEKAVWYLRREIEFLKSVQGKRNPVRPSDMENGQLKFGVTSKLFYDGNLTDTLVTPSHD